MKRAVYVSLAIAFVALVASGLAVAQEHQHDQDKEGDDGKKEMVEVTVVGTLVGTRCYSMDNENIGNDHASPNGILPKCAEACARMGIPVGLLKDGEKGGKLYILISPSTQLADHMAKTVKVKGVETVPGTLLPSQIWVKTDDGKWEEVKIATMM